MINTFSHVEKNARFSKRVVSAFFMLAAALFFIWYCQGNFSDIPVLSIIFAAAGISFLLPFIGQKMYFVMTILSSAIGFVILNSVTSCFYYLIFTPLALFLRLLKKNQISMKCSSEETTSWQSHSPVKELKQYMKQY